MSLDQCERDAMLGKKIRELLYTHPQEYRDGYVDGWVDMENEYRTQQATIERLERLRSVLKEETDRLNQVLTVLRAERNAFSISWKEAVEERERLKVLLDAALKSVERLEAERDRFKEQHKLCLDEIVQLNDAAAKMQTRLKEWGCFNDVLTAHLNGWEYYARPPE
jgi:chromosome segregation ATPase